MFTITSHILINVFQTVNFLSVKFTMCNEKNMTFILIPKSQKSEAIKPDSFKKWVDSYWHIMLEYKPNVYMHWFPCHISQPNGNQNLQFPLLFFLFTFCPTFTSTQVMKYNCQIQKSAQDTVFNCNYKCFHWTQVYHHVLLSEIDSCEPCQIWQEFQVMWDTERWWKFHLEDV